MNRQQAIPLLDLVNHNLIIGTYWRDKELEDKMWNVFFDLYNCAMGTTWLKNESLKILLDYGYISVDYYNVLLCNSTIST